MPDSNALGDWQGIGGVVSPFVLGILAWLNLRKGQADTHDIAADAQQLSRERFDHEQTVAAAAEKERVIVLLREENSRLAAARDADGLRHEREMERERAARDAERNVARDELRQVREDLASLAAVIRAHAENVAADEGMRTFRAPLVSDSDNDEEAP